MNRKTLRGIFAIIALLASLAAGRFAGQQQTPVEPVGQEPAAIALTQQATPTDFEGVAAFLRAFGRLPDNFITKAEAAKRGWDAGENHLSDVAPGKSIGGDVFGNYEGLLPGKKGRVWRECDIGYTSGPRGAKRIVYASDGLIYKTTDHYKSFTQMMPEEEP